MKYKVSGTLIHSTTDNVCSTVNVSYQIPEFIIEANDLQEAASKAKSIVCPIELTYEGISISLFIYKID